MKLLSIEGEELASLCLEGAKKEPLRATIGIGTIRFETTSEVFMEYKDDVLVGHIRIPGKVKFDLIVEKSDIKALKTVMDGDVIKFMISALMRG